MKHATMILAALFASMSLWADDLQEHPLIRPYPGSVLAENMSKHIRFEQHKFRIVNEETGKREDKDVKGEYWRLLYEVRKPDGSRVQDISRLEFFENYKAAALEKGGKVLHEDRSYLTFSIPREDGGITYCQLTGNAGYGQQDLVIIDEAPFERSLTFGAKEMKAALDKDGRVLLHDILFDVDKATLKPESSKQLQHVVALLRENTGLVLEVQGHTDDQGSDDYNMELSQRRAETVVAYLGLFGINVDRLTPKGYGESAPVESNGSEEGRAKNRRVELVSKSGARAGYGDAAAGNPPSAGAGACYRANLKMEGLSAAGGTQTKMSGTGTVEAMRKAGGTVYRVELEQNIEVGGQKMSMPMLTVFDGKDVFVETTVMGQKTVMKMPPDQPSTVIVSDGAGMLAKMEDTFDIKALPDQEANGAPCRVFELVPRQKQASSVPGGTPPFKRGEIFFAKKTDLPARWVLYDEGPEPLMTIDYLDYNTDVVFTPDRFRYTPPSGVSVMDMSAASGAM